MRRLLLPLLLALALTGCASGSDRPSTSGPAPSASPTQQHSTETPRLSYAALGDSYTAAPYVDLTDLALGCLRSDHNYPHVLARMLHASLRDVSCSGAQVHDLSSPQSTFHGQSVPAQLDAVSRSTGLVTLGIGGNDDGLFATLVAGCPVSAPGFTRVPPKGSRCGAVDVPRATAAIRDIGGRLRGALRAIHRRAPRARVVLVGYPRIAPTTSTCPSLLPVRHPDALVVDRMTRLLADAMRAAARATGSAYVDLYRASAGHDVCAARPWVNGVHTDTSRAAALHPFAVEQRAVAGLVAAVVKR